MSRTCHLDRAKRCAAPYATDSRTHRPSAGGTGIPYTRIASDVENETAACCPKRKAQPAGGPAHGAAERRQDACFHTGSIHFLTAVRHAGNSRHTRQPALRRCESSGCLVLRQSFRYGYIHSVVPLLALGSRASFFVHNSGIFKI